MATIAFTERDIIAIAAMVAGLINMDYKEGEGSHEAYANWCYDTADAMIARSKKD